MISKDNDKSTLQQRYPTLEITHFMPNEFVLGGLSNLIKSGDLEKFKAVEQLFFDELGYNQLEQLPDGELKLKGVEYTDFYYYLMCAISECSNMALLHYILNETKLTNPSSFARESDGLYEVLSRSFIYNCNIQAIEYFSTLCSPSSIDKASEGQVETLQSSLQTMVETLKDPTYPDELVNSFAERYKLAKKLYPKILQSALQNIWPDDLAKDIARLIKHDAPSQLICDMLIASLRGSYDAQHMINNNEIRPMNLFHTTLYQATIDNKQSLVVSLLDILTIEQLGSLNEQMQMVINRQFGQRFLPNIQKLKKTFQSTVSKSLVQIFPRELHDLIFDYYDQSNKNGLYTKSLQAKDMIEHVVRDTWRGAAIDSKDKIIFTHFIKHSIIEKQEYHYMTINPRFIEHLATKIAEHIPLMPRSNAVSRLRVVEQLIDNTIIEQSMTASEPSERRTQQASRGFSIG